jgi:BlaI family penicillinase repressor
MSDRSISNAEWEVMNRVWAGSPVSAAEIVEDLEARTGWKSRTIRTLIDRLVAKGVLREAHDGRRKVYRAAVQRRTCVRRESRSFTERVFAGEPGSMLVHLVREADLSAADIEALRRILREKEE